MIINDLALIQYQPIVGMLQTKERSNGVSHGLGEAGYDIRIKQDIWFENGRIQCQDPEGDGFEMTTTWGNFVLASAIEEFDMPTDLVGIVHDKSTWARQGLSVFNTVIEPGFRGGLTLELVYHGQKYLHIPAGAGIAQVVFHQLTNHTQYSGKYQNQPSHPVPAILSM